MLQTDIHRFSKGKGTLQILWTGEWIIMNGFLRKTKIWNSKFEKKDLEMFPHVADTDTDIISSMILEYLLALEDKLHQYFPSLDVNENDWVRNPFSLLLKTKYLLLEETEELADQIWSSSLGKYHYYNSGFW